MSAPGNRQRSAPDPYRDEWQTPPPLVGGINKLLPGGNHPFTLDPCSSPDPALVPTHGIRRRLIGPCTGKADCQCGLCARWSAEYVFVNPPYGPALVPWTRKCAYETDRSTSGPAALVAALVPAHTGSRWWHRAAGTASAVYLLEGRVPFLHPVTKRPVRGNTSDSSVFIWIAGHGPLAAGYQPGKILTVQYKALVAPMERMVGL